MKHRIAVSDKLVLRRMDDESVSIIGFNRLSSMKYL